MNPYLKSMPPVPEDFNAAMMTESASTVKQLVQQHNSLTYIDYIERLPDYRIMQRDLKQRGLSPAYVAPVLWMLGQSYELLPVPISPEIDRFDDVHFMYNSGALIDSVLRTLAQDVGVLYQKLNGAAADFTRIHSISKNSAFYYEMTDDHRKLYVQCKILTVVTDYREMFQRDGHMMDPAKVQERRNAAIAMLERASSRGDASPSVQKKKVEEELHFTMSGFQEVIPESIDPDVSATGVRASIEDNPRRAVDQPDWKQFEAAQKSGFTWDMVMRTFGPNMVIRILLRRQDYDQLLSMIEADFINDQAELRFCRESMDKIKQHDDVLSDREESYWRLFQYLKARGV
ncbi:MAG: hypothetical protein CVV45_06875 [Spirochaetae bacterium HGW-Spirochaetae-10]|nr:MAG: hypothetical protein CVV45_06875 [Spirochaetae bacterium HGW-Spirochaetae-10]